MGFSEWSLAILDNCNVEVGNPIWISYLCLSHRHGFWTDLSTTSEPFTAFLDLMMCCCHVLPPELEFLPSLISLTGLSLLTNELDWIYQIYSRLSSKILIQMRPKWALQIFAFPSMAGRVTSTLGCFIFFQCTVTFTYDHGSDSLPTTMGTSPLSSFHYLILA